MLADWSLAMAIDDRANFTPRRSQLSMPSWNTRDAFRGLNGYNKTQFPQEFPLVTNMAGYGTFSFDVTTLRGWGSAFFDLAGTPRGPQLVELRSLAGGSPPNALRMAIVRVE
jgi:hypothetical protein